MNISRISPLNFRGMLLLPTDKGKIEVSPDEYESIRPVKSDKKPYEGLILTLKKGSNKTQYILDPEEGIYHDLAAKVNMNFALARIAADNDTLEFMDLNNKKFEGTFKVKS